MPSEAQRINDVGASSEVQDRVWFAYSPNWQIVAVFRSEVDALRFAVEDHSRYFQVGYSSWGEPVGPDIGIRKLGDDNETP